MVVILLILHTLSLVLKYWQAYFKFFMLLIFQSLCITLRLHYNTYVTEPISIWNCSSEKYIFGLFKRKSFILEMPTAGALKLDFNAKLNRTKDSETFCRLALPIFILLKFSWCLFKWRSNLLYFYIIQINCRFFSLISNIQSFHYSLLTSQWGSKSKLPRVYDDVCFVPK